MSNRKRSHERLLTDPALLPEADREYYRSTWGFDPLRDRLSLGREIYRYEACMPLQQDLPLHEIGVTICARVEWRDKDIQNRIVFRHNQEEAAVNCTHLVIHAGPLDDALIFAEDVATHRGELDKEEYERVARAGGTVALPPWEHFAALKSYVAGVAEVGVITLLNFSTSEEKSDTAGLDFGFNTPMQVQVLEALKNVAPTSIQPILQDYAINLFNHVPARWIMDRWAYLEHLLGLGEIFGADPAPVFKWLMKWGRESPSNLLCGGTTESLQILLRKHWKALMRAWDADTIKRFLRQSNLADALQDYLFRDAGRLAKARAEAPDVPWGRLRQEWRGRRRVVQILTWENNADDIEVPHVKLLPIEVWPRGPLCEVDFPTFLTNNPDLNTPEDARIRLERFIKAEIVILDALSYSADEEEQREDIDVPQEVLLELIEWLREKYPTIYLSEIWDHFREKVVQSIQFRNPQNIEKIQKTHERFGEEVKNEIRMKFFIPDEFVMRSLESQDDLLEMAEHPDIPPEVANILVTSWNLAIRLALAGNLGVGEGILQKLANDIQPSVRVIVEARHRRNTPAIEPLPGEILTPGEILWLLVSHEDNYIFVNSIHIDESEEYARWYPTHWQQYQRWFEDHHSMRSLRLGFPSPTSHTWTVVGSFFWDVVQGIPDVFHLTLDGLRQLACGWLPCMYLGPEPPSFKR